MILSTLVRIALALWGGWGAAGIAAAAAIVWTVKNVVFLSSYSEVVLRLRWWTFYAPLLAGINLAGRWVPQLWWPESWLAIGVAATAIGAAYGVIAYALSLNRSDRDLLWSLLNRRSP